MKDRMNNLQKDKRPTKWESMNIMLDVSDRHSNLVQQNSCISRWQIAIKLSDPVAANAVCTDLWNFNRLSSRYYKTGVRVTSTTPTVEPPLCLVEAPRGFTHVQIGTIAQRYADVREVNPLAGKRGYSSFLVCCHSVQGAANLVGLQFGTPRDGDVCFTTGNSKRDSQIRGEVCRERKCCEGTTKLVVDCLTKRMESKPAAPLSINDLEIHNALTGNENETTSNAASVHSNKH
eukprot:TRINITY_DN113736_c0_g1_i1.p1 TRINITY_DN113736_c0_g1~~TRINITY_DN113736_c0_g1_i1.p1  ORF type:complete len:257 (-),score=11.54 TRINITY_DN113736_c0_g1_i1:257-955(-)